MTQTDHQSLAEAATLLAPIRRAAAIARFDGLLYCIGGVLSLMIALPGQVDVVGLLLGIALLSIGLFERSAARRLQDAHPTAALHVARAELAGLVVMCSYFLVAWLVLPPISEEFAAQAAQLGELGASIQRQGEALAGILYPTLLVTSFVVQSLVVRYFLRKRAEVARYHEQAPEWARRVVQGLAS